MGGKIMSGDTLKLNHDDTLLGAYEYLNLHTFVRHWPPLSEREIFQEASLEKRVQLSLARYSYIHETRHFHDFFGTLAGVSLFLAHFEMLRSFLTLFELIRRTDETWSLPFPKWADTSKFRDIHNRFLRRWSLYRRSAARFTGAFRATASPKQHTEDYIVYLETENASGKIAAFPFSLGLVEEGVNLSVYYPISFIALLEGNAQAIQRTLAEHEFPPEIAIQFTPKKIDHRISQPIEGLDDAFEVVAASSQPYNVTDYLVSKYLRLTYNQPSFQRESITRLTDIALSKSAILPLAEDELGLPTQFQVSDVGQNFIDALKQTPMETLVTGEIEYPQVLTTVYKNYLDTILNFPEPETVDYKGDLLSPLTMLESVLRHEVIAPLIQARIESKHEVFYSVNEYMKRFISLPKVPVLEYEGGLEFAPYMSNKAKDAWSKYVFLSRIVSEIASGSQVLTCPRAQGAVGGKGDMSFHFDGECRDEINRGACNGWYPTRPRVLPKCLFANSLKALGAFGGMLPNSAMQPNVK
jgi:hypothetical protein